MEYFNKRVRSLVKRNRIEIGFIGVIINKKEPFCVSFNIDGYDYIEKLCLDEIEILEEIMMTNEELYDIVHLKNEKILSGQTLLVIPDDEIYYIKLDDLKKAITLCENETISIDAFAAWFYTIYFSNSAFRYFSNDEILLDDLFEMIDDFFKDESMDYFSYISEPILNRINAEYKNKNLMLKDKILTDKEMLSIINEGIYNRKCINDLEYVEAMPVFLSKLEKYSFSYFIKGTLYYYGTFGYPKDYDLALEAFHKAYDMSNYDALWFLGKIYYDLKEYDIAYKFLTYAYIQDYYPSHVILSDMFKNGYGVSKDENTAFKLVIDAVNNVKPSFEAQNYVNYFADAIIKLGELYDKGIGTLRDPNTALICYLEGNYALKKRYNYVYLPDDNKLKKKCINNIKRLNAELGFKESSLGNISNDYFYYIKKMMDISDELMIKVKMDGNYVTLDFYSTNGNKKLITEPSCNYVALTNKLSLSFSMASFKYKPKNKMIVDEIDLLSEIGSIIFFKHNKPINKLSFQDVYLNCRRKGK